MYSFPNLFITPGGSPMDFYVASPDFDLLKIYIEAGGGKVKDTPYGPYTIILSNSCASSEYGVRDVFHTDFILNSCTRNSVVSLKNLRVKDTAFNDEFNPQDILKQTLTWETAKDKFLKGNGNTDLTWYDNLVIFNGAVPKVILKKVSSFPNARKSRSSAIKKSSESEDSDFKEEMEADSSDLSDFTYDSEAPRASLGRRVTSHSCNIHEYTEEDDLQIINFIINCKGFSNLKHKDLWTNMAKVLKQHSWISLKNRFMRKLVFKLHHFNLAPEILRKFKKHTDRLVPSDQGSVSSRSNHGLYTFAEDQLILDYIKKKAKPSTKLSGNKFWMDMERLRVVKGRTWQSLRERYVKKLSKQRFEEREKSNRASKVKDSKSPKKCSNAVALDSEEEVCDKEVSDGEVSEEEVCNEEQHIKNKGTCNQLNEIKTVMLSSDDEQASNSSEKHLVKSPKKVKRHKRKLFNKVDDFNSPQSSSNLPTPVSVHRTGPNRLDNEVNQYMRFIEFKKRKMKKNNIKASNVQKPLTLPKPPETIKKAEALKMNISKTLMSNSIVVNHKEVVINSNDPELSPDPSECPRKKSRSSTSEACDSSVENHKKIINHNREYIPKSSPKPSKAIRKIRACRIFTSEASDSSDSSTCDEAEIANPKLVQSNKPKKASVAGSVEKSPQLSRDLFGSEASPNSNKEPVCSAASEDLLQPWGGFTPEELIFDDNEHPKGKGSQCESNAHAIFLVEGERSKSVNCKFTSTQKDETEDLHCSVLPLSPIMFEKGLIVNSSLKEQTPKISKIEESAQLSPNESESSDENDSWSEDGLGWRGCAYRLVHKEQPKPLTECERSVENMINSESETNEGSASPDIQESTFVDPMSTVLPDSGTQESAFVDPVSTVPPGNGTQESTFVDPVSTVSPDNGIYESACAQRLTESSSTNTQNAVCSEQVSPIEIESPEDVAEPDLEGTNFSSTARSGSPQSIKCAKNKEESPRRSPRLMTSAQKNVTLRRSASGNVPVTAENSETDVTFNFDFHTNRNILSNSGIFEDIEDPPIRKRSCLSTPSPEKDKSLSPLSLSTRHVHWHDEKDDHSVTPIGPNQGSKRDACTSPLSSRKNPGSVRDACTSPISSIKNPVSMRDACTSPMSFEQVPNAKRNPRTCTCPCSCTSPVPARFMQRQTPILSRCVENYNNHEGGNQPVQLTPPHPNRRTSAKDSCTPVSPQCSTMSISPKSPAPGDIRTRSASRYDSLEKRTRSKTKSDSSLYGYSSPVSPKRI